jgi:cytochrome c2
MLPEQQDILWTFVTIIFSLFSMFAFINVIMHCRSKEGTNTVLWGSIFGAGFIINLMLTNHMFGLTQQEQLGFISNQVLAVFLTLLTWGVFFKSENIEDQSPPLIRAAFFYSTISILLAGYTNWLPQQRSDPPPKAEPIDTSSLTMETYTTMGETIVFGKERVAGSKAIGKGQCPLCHTFDAGDNIGRCPNLFGVEERSHTRIKEDRYLNEPIKIGEKDGATGIMKGKPDQIPEEYRRADASELTGEDYLRESLMCPSCYVVKGYGKAGDTKSPMPVISKPPISLGKVELNSVIAWLQAKDTPGDFANVTIPLPTAEDSAPADDGGGDAPEPPTFVTGAEPIDVMINTLGCPLCHTIPGIEGAVGELGPKLHEKVNAPKRIKDPNYKGKAKTGRDYVKESILNPNAYIVFNEEAGEPFPEGVMPQDFANKLSVNALDKLVDFISNTQPEG